ncbi:MAG: NADH-quinone oxidoreductase subunit A [Deltaproteobacteria bacterium GWA2_54_12]|nr:MAG: NADH-quinone oxidoreductase subunit A [Deltaproteobacteria bacterium GWA2_54_12]
MDAQAHWPLAAYFLIIILLVCSMLIFSWLLGERQRQRATAEPYESGITPTGSARLRFDMKFYIVAMLFVIFDVEAAFIYAWAVAVRELGWAGFVEAAIFISVLLAALAYLWRMGALDWGTSGKMKKSA